MKLNEKIVKHRKIILIATAIIAVLSIVGLAFFILDGRINSDMLEYLPDGTSTSDGIAFLKENFNIEGDAFVVVEGDAEDAELAEKVEKMRNIEGVTQFLWYGDVLAMDELASSLANLGISFPVDAQPLMDYMRQPIDKDDPDTKYNYVLLVLFDYSPSTPEAFNVHKQIREELAPRSVAISGMTALADRIMTETLGEAVYYILFGILAIAVVLLLTTSSFFEPVILLVTLGVSILVNMGTNLIFPQVSIISFAACGVLQLGISMDYAIIFMHIYKEKRRSLDPASAAASTIPSAMTSIIASGLTTIGGFAALAFMEFTLGVDLALVVVKGIALSVVTVLILQPCLTVVCDKLLIKTAHKQIHLGYGKVAEFSVKKRKWLVAAALLLIVPAFFAQSSVGFSYLKIYSPIENPNSQEILAEKLGNQIITAVPLIPKEGTQTDYIAELLEDEKIGNVMGAYSAISLGEKELAGLLALLEKIQSSLPASFSAIETLFRQVDGRWYTLYLIEINGDTEDEAAFNTHSHITTVTDKYFDESYPLGMLTGVYDMAEITPRDFVKISLISALIILAVMTLLLKSFGKSFVMVLLIELAIWINIGLNFVFGAKMNFMVYILIGSVQLGCTVDYGILLATKFEEEKRRLNNSVQGAVSAAKSSFSAITLSASMITVACLAITFVSKNLLVKEMAWVLARGAMISYALVVLVLPALLAFFNRIRPDRKRKLRKQKTETV